MIEIQSYRVKCNSIRPPQIKEGHASQRRSRRRPDPCSQPGGLRRSGIPPRRAGGRDGLPPGRHGAGGLSRHARHRGADGPEWALLAASRRASGARRASGGFAVRAVHRVDLVAGSPRPPHRRTPDGPRLAERLHRAVPDRGRAGAWQPRPRQAQWIQAAAAAVAPTAAGSGGASGLVLANVAPRRAAVKEPGRQLQCARGHH
ncbi:hypothetical protein G6F31_017513 [Rhizopus arrhizus]|nr:hypothetical protein G6F31_017513 [Rhizopus arrhizus]